MAILQALVLGYFVYRLGRALYGYAAGALALGFFAFCPNMMAYGSLITPDITLTVFFFITVFYLRMALVTGEGRNHLLAGISLGLALLSKFPALLLLPIGRSSWHSLPAGGRRIPVRWIAASAGCAAAVFLLGYGFDPRPYVQGMAVQQLHQQEGHWSFLMGQLSRDGWSVLRPRGVRAEDADPAACSSWRRRWASWSPGRFGDDRARRPRPRGCPSSPSSCSSASNGGRSACATCCRCTRSPFVIASGAVLPGCGGSGPAGRSARLVRPVVADVWPDYLAYFNEFAGGPNGDRILVDSNLDWGQDLKGLKRFMDSRGIDRIYLSYFGTDSPRALRHPVRLARRATT